MVARREPPKPKRGRGRPLGAKNKRKKEVVVIAEKSGDLPHVFAVKLSQMKVGDTIKDHEVTWDDIKWATNLAAPYYAPKYSHIQLAGDPTRPIKLDMLPQDVLSKLGDEQLAFLEVLIKMLSTGTHAKLIEHQGNPNAYAASLGEVAE